MSTSRQQFFHKPLAGEKNKHHLNETKFEGWKETRHIVEIWRRRTTSRGNFEHDWTREVTGSKIVIAKPTISLGGQYQFRIFWNKTIDS